MVAPYSGAMLATTARLPADSVATPGPKNSTNSPDTPIWRSRCVTVSARSVASAPGGRAPVSSTPITSGMRSMVGMPNMTVCASSPPTPQPSTPMPLIMGVWLSVPIIMSGAAQRSPPRSSSRTSTASCSRFNVCMMPVPGGWMRTPRSAGGPAQEAVALAVAADLVADVDAGRVRAAWTSTASEWSTDTSTGSVGLSRAGSAPASASASRMAAISTSAGVLVVSCISTRPGWKAISASLAPSRNQSNSAATVAARSAPRWWRTTFSSSSRSTTGRRG